MTIVDAVIILFLLSGVVLGLKKGAIRSLVGLIGTVLVLIIAYYLKNPVADILFNFVPFVNFSGDYTGLVTLNILLYESIAYILVFMVLSSVLSLALKVSGIIEKILNATIILGIPSKILGAILGLVEAVFFSFIVLFVFMQLSLTHDLVSESKVANIILKKTPIVSGLVEDTYQAIEDISSLKDKYKGSTNKDEYNKEILEIMLDKKVVTPEVTRKLIDNKKLDFNGAESVLNAYIESEDK